MKHIVLVLFVALTLVTLSISSVSAGEPGTFKFEGKGYFYYLHDMTKGDGQSNSFDLSRMYMGVKHYISEDFTIRYITDIGHQGSDKDGKFEVFTKYAYLDWKLSGKTHLVMGLQGTNNWSAPEKAWGYRQIQYSPMESFGKFWGSAAKAYSAYLGNWAGKEAIKANFDLARASKMGSSADLGIALKMKVGGSSYVNFMIRNGGGYKSSENNMFKNFQVRGGTYLMDKAVHVSAYVEMEPFSGKDEDGASTTYNNFQWDVTASYTIKGMLTAGVDINSKTFAGIEDVTAMCISAFGNMSVMPKMKALVRYDMYNTGFNDMDVMPGADDFETNGSRIVLGMDYKAHKKVSIIPNLQILSYEDDRESKKSVYVHCYFKI